MILLEAQFDATKQLPTFAQLTSTYGPWMGLVVALVITILISQYHWFRRLVRAKDKEIERLIVRENELNKRLMALIDQEIGYKKKK